MATGRMKTLLIATAFTASTVFGLGAASSKMRTKAQEKTNRAPLELRLKDKALSEKNIERDSLKEEILKADDKGRIEMGNGTIIYAAPNSTIVKIPPKIDGKIVTPILMDDPQYGLQPKTADAFRSTATGTATYQNGEFTDISVSFSQVQTFPAHTNGIMVFQQGHAYTFQCNFLPLRPQWQAVKSAVFKSYLGINFPPLDTNNFEATAQLIRNFLITCGENPQVAHNSLLGFNYARGPPLWQLPTKWHIMVVRELDSLGNLTTVRGPPVIYAVGLCDGYIIPPGNADKTTGAMFTPTGMAYDNGNGNYQYSMCGGAIGGYAAYATPNHAGFLVYETIIGVTPISTEIPTSYSLSQNYPNPFNAQTKMKIEVPKAGMVSLRVYDALGREVATLVNESMKAGTYDVGWNAGALPSGAYFYRMSTGEFTETKKMLLVK